MIDRMPGERLDEATLDHGASTASGLTPPGERRLVLVVLAGSGLCEVELGHKDQYEVGRTRSADVFVDDPSVSRNHAVVIPAKDHVIVRDRGSTNRTFVDNELVGRDGTEVRPGQVIRFGSVAAHLHLTRARQQTGRVVLADEFDRRVADEEERCLRSGRPIALIAAEVPARHGATLDALRSVIAQSLRPSDLLTFRGRGRIDAMIVDCQSREDAVAVAERIREALAKQDVVGKLGVALFPGDAASSENLRLAAEVALGAAADNSVGVAGTAARTLRIGSHDVLIASPEMMRVFGLVERLAAAPLSVLVHGETGCGKELVAEALHYMGPRASGPLVKVNCAAVPHDLLESELFGHERGAFSGATTAKPGMFETAHEGTMFLDEIAEMSPGLQAKLLRVLEDRRVRRVGAVTDRVVDVRVIAATHQDLLGAAEEGRFRADLFYRLSAAVIEVPPLRERTSEILPLAEQFAADMARMLVRPPLTITSSAAQQLLRHAWPGNVRELRNVIGRTVALCEGDEIRAEHLALATPTPRARTEPPIAAGPRPRPHTEQMAVATPYVLRDPDEVERRRIGEALDACGGNQTKAAELLQMPRRTLVYKLTALGIRTPRGRSPRTKT
jgi:two-component system, NtrC family, response regulator AtoC